MSTGAAGEEEKKMYSLVSDITVFTLLLLTPNISPLENHGLETSPIGKKG